ncbi:phage integrase N-terminal SAM-like domain-containing protein [Vibrio splendidus]|uniref:phage integrase N-terminal SAM-like domain-containing protein n=1 Tax=Vibrio splendidus TaxID=29497 RepID=UPI0039A479C6
MKPDDLKRYNTLYEQHLTNLKLQGKRPATIDAYSRAVRRITAHFDRVPDTLTTADLKQFFVSYSNPLVEHHKKLDRNGLQFFYRYTLDKQWEWLNIVKPPQVKRLPDILRHHSKSVR